MQTGAAAKKRHKVRSGIAAAIAEENHYSLLFLNDEQDRGFIFICQKASEGSGLFIIDVEEREYLTMRINAWEVDCYLSEEDCDYVWHDTEGKVFFSMNSNLPHDVNVRIIENLRRKK